MEPDLGSLGASWSLSFVICMAVGQELLEARHCTCLASVFLTEPNPGVVHTIRVPEDRHSVGSSGGPVLAPWLHSAWRLRDTGTICPPCSCVPQSPSLLLYSVPFTSAREGPRGQSSGVTVGQGRAFLGFETGSHVARGSSLYCRSLTLNLWFSCPPLSCGSGLGAGRSVC